MNSVKKTKENVERKEKTFLKKMEKMRRIPLTEDEEYLLKLGFQHGVFAGIESLME